jgi:8-oxo-dGTP pyrophosphatase MutT (NUDIX family)
MFSLTKIRAALADHEPGRLESPQEPCGRASVAMVLSGAGSRLSVCFIRRTARPGDPWSGHMALPGGGAAATDPTPEAAAERETREEVGVALSAEQRLGGLSEMPIRPRPNNSNAVLSPFVYYVGPQAPALRPQASEVAAAHWIGLDHLWALDNQTTVEHRRSGAPVVSPGIRFEGQVIWGLTYRVLDSFGAVLGRPLPARS